MFSVKENIRAVTINCDGNGPESGGGGDPPAFIISLARGSSKKTYKKAALKNATERGGVTKCRTLKTIADLRVEELQPAPILQVQDHSICAEFVEFLCEALLVSFIAPSSGGVPRDELQF